MTAERATAEIGAPQAALTHDHEPAVKHQTLTGKDVEEIETVVLHASTIDAALAEAGLQPAAVVGEVKEEKAKETNGGALVTTAGPDPLRPAVASMSAQVLGTRTATVLLTGAALQTTAEVSAQTVPTVRTLNREVPVATKDRDPGTTIAAMVALRAEVAQQLSLLATETLLARTLKTALV